MFSDDDKTIKEDALNARLFGNIGYVLGLTKNNRHYHWSYAADII